MARKKPPTEEESTNENLGNKSESDDTFGLPEIDYKPLERDTQVDTGGAQQEVVPAEQPTRHHQHGEKSEYTYIPPEEATPVWPKVLGIVFVVVLALGASWYFLWYQPQQNEKVRVLAAKQKSEQEARTKKENELAAAQRLREEAELRRADSLANASKVGVIEILSERTNRYYVVIASAVDDDLLMDYAKKLSSSGVSTKIIPPFRKYKVFRLTIANGDTFALTQGMADAKKVEYGDALWVLRY